MAETLGNKTSVSLTQVTLKDLRYDNVSNRLSVGNTTTYGLLDCAVTSVH